MTLQFWQDTSWFAVQAKPHQEDLAAAVVAQLGNDVFLPRIRREQSVCGVRRLISKPLFAGYLFARFCPRISMDAVRYARGVLRVLGTSRHPLPVEDGIIDSIRERVREDGFVHLETRPFLPGDKVTIDAGPFAGWMGKVEREWADGKRVMLLLEAVQQTRALIDKRWLRPAEAA
jgi:transcriptional antiterminator RfaH